MLYNDDIYCSSYKHSSSETQLTISSTLHETTRLQTMIWKQRCWKNLFYFLHFHYYLLNTTGSSRLQLTVLVHPVHCAGHSFITSVNRTWFWCFTERRWYIR